MMATATGDALQQRFALLAMSGLPTPELEELVVEIQRQLAAGELSVVVPASEGQGSGRAWHLVPWVKRALMLAAQLSIAVAQPEPWTGTELQFAPWRRDRGGAGLIPFGCHLRGSAFVAESAVLTPSAVVQAGAHVGNQTLLDAHVLVGNCAYVGDQVVLQAGAVVAGHLLPELALPNIVEDGCQLGGGSGLYDGIILGSGSILLPGTMVSAKAGVFDLGQACWILPDALGNLWLPPGSVLGMGSRPVGPPSLGMQRATAMVVGRRAEMASNVVWYDQGVASEEVLNE